jgi:hypothetical protein
MGKGEEWEEEGDINSSYTVDAHGLCSTARHFNRFLIQDIIDEEGVGWVKRRGRGGREDTC